ncbi:hypothetical protein [Neobacillus sp. Marseille-QA0830]
MTRRVAVVAHESTGQSRGRVKVRRKSASNNSLKPKTRIAVARGFNEVLSANDKAVELIYNR